MSRCRDTKREECLKKKPEQQYAFLDVLIESSNEEMEGATVLLEALIIDPEDEIRFLTRMKKLLVNNDSRLKYVLGGDAIENPYVADRETQLRYLMDLFCEERTGGGYKCAACDEEHSDLDGLHQHLLRHSDCKFYFCVHCLEGFSTLSEMARHKVAHIDKIVLLESGSKLLKRPRSPESLDFPHSYVPEEQQACSTEEERGKDYHCTFCGFTFDRLDVVLFHTEQDHPTERVAINHLRLRLLRAAFDPKGYRLGNAGKEESAPSSIES
ncbi:hypothetical protein TSMEX_003785 [Taenia solium]|eukprot:TsM_000431800 transcript=TsM_000431800 gene=TsM_000431800